MPSTAGPSPDDHCRPRAITLGILPFLVAGITGLSAKDFDVTVHGAVGDGSTVSTTAIQRAIDACAAAGGGRVVIPNGTFMVAGIVLRSHVTLFLCAGAVLRGMPRLEDYSGSTKTFVSAQDAADVGIEGSGTLDGNGSAFWRRDEAFVDRKEPWAGATHQAWMALPRPANVRFDRCAGVTVKGVTITNAPTWTLHVSSSDRVHIAGVTIRNPLHGPNTDGIDLNMCREVVVEDCDISTGDDGIVLKCTSEKEKRVSRNIMVRRCRIETTCQAFKIGTETLDGFENITFRDSIIHNRSADPRERASAGVAIESVDGGTVDGVSIAKIQMENVRAPLFIRLGNRGRGQKGGTAVPGAVRNVVVEDITARHALMESSITGIPGHPVEGVTLRNIDIELEGGGRSEWASARVKEAVDAYPAPRMFGIRLPASGFYCRHAKNLSFHNVTFRFLTPDGRPTVILDDVQSPETAGLQDPPVVISAP